MASITELFTREDCNKVERLTIKGDNWLEYLGTDSDAFRKAKREMQALVVADELKTDDVEPFLLASLITDWSFDEECNDENKRALLANSPSLAEAIDRAASKRANFTKRLQANSTATPKTGSGSRNRKTQKTSSK